MHARLASTLFLHSVFLGALLVVPMPAAAQCDYQPDAPDCACFDDTGAWNPGALHPDGPIQEVALETVGTKESCKCPGTADCDWDPDPLDNDVNFDDSGKPYYQMVLGLSSEASALYASCVLSVVGSEEYRGREWWCSETISYWHRAAGIPYPGGLRASWRLDWQHGSVGALKTWYQNEEDEGGRGRWIDPGDVDYADFELGRTVPVPGAYVAIRAWNEDAADWGSASSCHSLMINEMWVHRDAFGNVFQVEVSLLEGNSGERVKDTGFWTDLLSLTPQGSGPGSRRIYGFGIDLDAAGQPIYDETRLHEVAHPEVVRAVALAPLIVVDPEWEEHVQRFPGLAAYARMLRQQGGPIVTVSSGAPTPRQTSEAVQALQIGGIPDGATTSWHFPAGLQEEVVVDIDLLAGHPLPIVGLELTWAGDRLPRGYQVVFVTVAQDAIAARVPDASECGPTAVDVLAPVTATLPLPRTDIRYVRLIFPPGAFGGPPLSRNLVSTESTPDVVTLTELRILYDDQGAFADTANPPEESMVLVDIKPGSCPNPVNPKSRGVLPVAILGSELLDVRTIDPASVRIEGVGAEPVRYGYEDVAAPFIGSAGDCHALGADGYLDLTLKFRTADVVRQLGLARQAGETIPLAVTGRLREASAGTPISGRDFVRVVGGKAAKSNQKKP